eukprot:16077_1
MSSTTTSSSTSSSSSSTSSFKEAPPPPPPLKKLLLFHLLRRNITFVDPSKKFPLSSSSIQDGDIILDTVCPSNDFFMKACKHVSKIVFLLLVSKSSAHDGWLIITTVLILQKLVISFFN